ncbi:MAG: 5'/3'-nucleotidase SurE [Gemmatimonadetes bacterium]|nr:5'/3'-nucleotidase SurE [Gemmatimonadota bacterium]
MKILISNDDGILARGLEILEQACRKVGDVTVVAPDREQSASSHSLTMTRPLRPVKRADGRYQVDGTPTDCVLLALETILDHRPDIVFSGINHGSNMGEDVLYSGTVAAAMEGLSVGIPGVAMSFAGVKLELIETQFDWIAKLTSDICRVDDFPRETLLNVNLPPIPGSEVKGIRVTKLGRRVYSDSLTRMNDPWGRDMFWIGAGKSSWSGDEDSDFRAVEEGYISVTPLHLDLTQYDQLDTVRSWNLGA